MKQFQQFAVAGVLIHEILKGEVHEIILDQECRSRISWRLS
jgi:hypothetical protein